jgi:uncharacterized protein YutE (UPF0331/DUF86 family)
MNKYYFKGYMMRLAKLWRKKMFRQRIHVYNHIDTKTFYDILINEIGDIKNLYKDLLKIIDKYKK